MMTAPLSLTAVLLLCAPALAWQSGDSRSTPERPASGERPAVVVRGPLAPSATLVLYDVRDMVTDEPTDPRGEAPAESDFGYVRLARPKGGLVDTPRGLAGLVHLVETYLEPSLEDTPAQVLAIEGGQLMVVGVAEQQDWVAEFLRLQREETRLFLMVTAMWQVPHGALDDLFDRPDEQGALINTGVSMEGLRARVEAAGGQQVSAPTMVLEPRQRGSVAVMNQRSYVVDWSASRVEPDQRVVLDPQIEIVDEGTVLEARGVTLPGQRIGLELAITTARIEEPVRTERIEVEPGLPEQEVSLVVQRTLSARTSLVLAQGFASMLVPAGAGDRDVVVSLVFDWVVASPGGRQAMRAGDEPGERRDR